MGNKRFKNMLLKDIGYVLYDSLSSKIDQKSIKDKDKIYVGIYYSDRSDITNVCIELNEMFSECISLGIDPVYNSECTYVWIKILDEENINKVKLLYKLNNWKS